MAVRTLPRGPPGEGGPRTKLKIMLSTARSWQLSLLEKSIGFGDLHGPQSAATTRDISPSRTHISARRRMHVPPLSAQDLAVLRAKIKIKNFRIRAGNGPKPMISLRKLQSGPSPGTPRAKGKIKNHFEHSQEDLLRQDPAPT